MLLTLRTSISPIIRISPPRTCHMHANQNHTRPESSRANWIPASFQPCAIVTARNAIERAREPSSLPRRVKVKVEVEGRRIETARPCMEREVGRKEKDGRKDAHLTRVKERVHWSVFNQSHLYTFALLSFLPDTSLSPFRSTFPSLQNKDSSVYMQPISLFESAVKCVV